ncbi:MAG: spherulation-specific family 4 protein [Actinoallomurus sp.]
MPGLAVLVPAYFHPALFPSEWARLADPRLATVVLNVHNGPGPARDPVFAAAVDRVLAAGGRVAGYIDTAYGARPAGDIDADARRYRAWYGVADVFLDQVAAGPEALQTYRRTCEELRSHGVGFIVGNHGVHPDPGYASVADVLVTFEGPWSAYMRLRPPEWATRLPARRLCHLVYAIPPGTYEWALRLACRNNAGVVYVTDGDGANPWGRLPSHFEHAPALPYGRWHGVATTCPASPASTATSPNPSEPTCGTGSSNDGPT